MLFTAYNLSDNLGDYDLTPLKSMNLPPDVMEIIDQHINQPESHKKLQQSFSDEFTDVEADPWAEEEVSEDKGLFSRKEWFNEWE